MVRFKQFTSVDGMSAEVAINHWLEQARPDIQFMTQSSAPDGGSVVSFLYEEGFQATEQRLTEAATAIVQQAYKDRAGAPLLDPVVVEEDMPGR